jgi:putative hydrolase of the HAD superfamily
VQQKSELLSEAATSVAPQKLGIHPIRIDVHGDGLPGSTVKPDRIICSLMELVPGR